jgi:hypothetical protein
MPLHVPEQPGRLNRQRTREAFKLIDAGGDGSALDRRDGDPVETMSASAPIPDQSPTSVECHGTDMTHRHRFGCDFAVSRALSMKSCTTGPSARFFSVHAWGSALTHHRTFT